jgi:acyl-CoA thioester hydrolase
MDLAPLSSQNHILNFRVNYGDTDSGGVMYYGRYPYVLECGRTEYLRDFARPVSDLEKDPGMLFVVRKMNVEYLKSAFYDDLLTITSRIIKLTPVRILFAHEVLREGIVINRSEVELASISIKTKRPFKMTREFRDDLFS